MKILINLRSDVSAFHASPTQVAALAARLPMHAVTAVASKEAFLTALPAADAVMVWSFPAKWYPLAPRLRHVLTPAAGRDRVQPDPRGVVERHFGGFHGALMAESLLGMMYFMNRRFGVALANQRRVRWDSQAFRGTRRLAGQTALIVGYGRIGRKAAFLLSAASVRVLGLKRDTRTGCEGAERLFSPAALPEALAQADHVVCILPADTGTDRLLDATAFSHMKQGAFVYNLGRGNAIAVDALVEALSSGKLGGAFLDVFADEPLPIDSPLWQAPNLYLTPHASAIYDEYLDLYFEEVAGVLSALRG